MNFHLDALLEVLPAAGKGWLGVFIVTAVILLSVVLLNAATSKKQ